MSVCSIIRKILRNTLTCFLLAVNSDLTWNRFPASRVIPWARSGSGPASPGRFFPEPEGPVPTLVTGMSSSPPAGVEPGSMTIGPQGSNQ
ncbi:unnamed protein product [Brassica oleracea]|uniref:(rape) hypothetical protein n=1 Tax=Brassica napus TaxID=3708 RepID=A0A816HYP0_BRANA|nr:unnamed protein product [Brassica napus]